jgi:hypothetical protein
MRKLLALAVLVLLACGAGAAVTFWLTRPQRFRPPDPPALVVRMREVARLETLEVSLYKKVSFEPEPQPTGSTMGDAIAWAKFTLRPPKGRAIVFANVHLGLDLSKLDPASLRVDGEQVQVVLPPIKAQVELRPGETEVIGSNLDSQQTAQLLEVAREAFEREVGADPALKERARVSAERSLRALFLELGFRDVRFVPVLSGPNAG